MKCAQRVGWLCVLLALTAVVSLVSSAGQVLAATESSATPNATPVDAALPAFGIYPKDSGPQTYFDVKQAAGTSASYTVVLVNGAASGSAPFVGRTYASNAHIRINGGLDSGEPNDPKLAPTTWLNYPTDVVTIDPGHAIERTFKVDVPVNTPPGQYECALVIETKDAIPIPGTPSLKQNIRHTIAFVLTVPGELKPSFAIEDVHLVADESWSGVEATINNTGNVLVKPAGTMTVSTTDGTPIVSVPLGFGSFYAFHKGPIQAGLGGALAPGDYLLTIDLRDPATGAAATVENVKIKTVTQGELAASNAPPIAFNSASGELKPSADKPQFLNVAATITNSGDSVDGAELSILAYKDGKLVETYVLVSPLALPKGDTRVNSRYIPADGFSKGTWTFKLSVQVRDPKSGVATVLNTVELGQPVTIP